MTVTDLQQEPTDIPLVQWIVDYSFDPPQRRALIDFDVNTLISLVDVAEAATYAPGAQTKLNAELIRDFGLRVIRELESRSMVDYSQWKATEHLAASE